MHLPDPDDYRSLMLNLHHKVKSQEWWIYNFPGEQGEELRDYTFGPFLQVLEDEDYGLLNIVVAKEDSKPFTLFILFMRKSQVPKELIAATLTLAFPSELAAVIRILKSTETQDIVTLGGSAEEMMEVMTFWQVCHNIDPENPPPFPTHLQGLSPKHS